MRTIEEGSPFLEKQVRILHGTATVIRVCDKPGRLKDNALTDAARYS